MQPSNQPYTTQFTGTPITTTSQYVNAPMTTNQVYTTPNTQTYTGNTVITTPLSGGQVYSGPITTTQGYTGSYAGTQGYTGSYAGTQGYTSYGGVQGISGPIVGSQYPNAPIVNDPMLETPIMDENVQRISSYQDKIKTDFGKIKAVEVVTFKEAELERTLNGITTFGTVGVLQVLYFANFDRFVLSLNDWKYALLKRLPITGSESSTVGPVTYTLPTYNGFYTLTLPKVAHIEALKNLETILLNNTRFNYRGNEGILGRSTLSAGARSPDDKFRRLNNTPPTEGVYDPAMTNSQFGVEDVHPTMSKGQRVKRGFKKFGFLFKKKMSRKEKNNLNNYQARDIDSIKKTNEIQAAIHHFPRREVERWITYNKEIANSLGYYAEGYNEGGSPLGESRLRGYGSVDLGQGSLSNPIALTQSISTVRPPLEDLGYSVGQLHASAVPHRLARAGPYTKPKWTDKLKSKIPGEHHYYGEKSAESRLTPHSHSIHPHLNQRLETTLGTSITNPTPGMIGGAYSSAFGQGIELGPQSGQLESARDSYSTGPILTTSTVAPMTTTTTTTVPVMTTTPVVVEEYRQSFAEPAATLNRDIASGTYIPTTEKPSIIERIEDKITGHHHTEPTTITSTTVAPTYVEEVRPTYVEEVRPTVVERIENRLEGHTHTVEPTLTSSIVGREGLVQPVLATNTLPSLSERIRTIPVNTSGINQVESMPFTGHATGVTTTEKPSFLKKVTGFFTGSNEQTTGIREVPANTTTGIQSEHIDIIRGGNAHYQA